MELLEFESVAFSVDDERRTIRCVVVPWGKVGKHRNGRSWRFARGGLKYSHVKYVKFNNDHDRSQWLGRAIAAEDTEEGLVMTFKVKEGPRGDRALAQAKEGTKTGFSVEVEMDTADLGNDPENPGALLVAMANLTGVGFVKEPAFNDSRLISVMASRDGGIMPDDQTGVPGTAPADTPEQAPAPVMFSADQVAWMQANGVGINPAPASPAAAERPESIPPRVTATTEVSEALPYRFSYNGERHVFRSDADHDFSTDLFTVMRKEPGAGDAEARINGMIRAAFADVEQADVTALNPNRHRPDMWTPQMDLPSPLWDMVNSGTTDGSKFDIPKFTSSAGLVVPATEKVEPAAGSYVAELQTITPTQVWGKVEITRQAWRAGGSPQLSGILWDQMLREYSEDREDAVATFLNTLTAAADVTLTGTPLATPDNDDDQVTVNDLEMAIADLQFARGGRGIRAFAVHQALFRVLARVKDDAGRPMYPIISPSNANGTSQERFQYIDIAGVRAVGARSLGTVGTAAVNSWLFDPAKVRGWASAPERLFWDFGATVQTANIPQLSFVTLGIYGDVAFGNTDIAGVRQVIFDPSV
jgi:HK97 family phage prohead protease